MFFLTIARDTGVGPKSKDLGLSVNSLHFSMNLFCIAGEGSNLTGTIENLLTTSV